MKTKDELIEIAKGINNNTIFSTFNIHPKDMERMLPMIFIPIMFGVKLDFEPGMAYAYWEDSLPRGANGYPCFGKVSFLTKEETEIVREKLIEIKEAVKQIK